MLRCGVQYGLCRCDLRIISDANQFFIETILECHGLLGCFSHIVTNPSFVDGDGRLGIFPYHDVGSPSHGCNLCPPNLCKVNFRLKPIVICLSDVSVLGVSSISVIYYFHICAFVSSGMQLCLSIQCSTYLLRVSQLLCWITGWFWWLELLLGYDLHITIEVLMFISSAKKMFFGLLSAQSFSILCLDQ